MIVVKLLGGLGNQMFQYAAARSVDRNSLILIDLSFLLKNKKSYKDFTARNFELAVFKNIKTSTYNQTLVRLLLIMITFKRFLLSKAEPIKIISDDNFQSYIPLSETLQLEGYFQNPKYLEPIRHELLEEFKFPTLPKHLQSLLKYILEKTSVAIHIRRADYLKKNINAIHGILPIAYYQEAISLIKQRIKDPTFFIFSDDIKWCRENFLLEDEFLFIDYPNNPAWAELYLISCCKHQIIANSTFSWWGAWLNQNDEKIVIAPRKWFVKQQTDIIPKEWISL